MLEDVLYFGPVPSLMAESLRRVSGSLTLAGGEAMSGQGMRPHQVVVAIRPSAEVLGRAAQQVAPGGCLYVEGRREAWRRPLWRAASDGRRATQQPLRHAEDYVAAVQGLGLTETEAYWHWPDFDSCCEIVPLSDATAIAHALGRRGGSLQQHLKAALGRGLLCAGIFARMVPCFSIVARRGAARS